MSATADRSTDSPQSPATPEPATATAEPTTTDRAMRIGEVAQLTGTTPRTIRYWEEMGLLDGGGEREQGKHRCYSHSEVERIQEIVRLKDLLNLSLEQLAELLEAETARAEIRREYHATEDPDRQRELLQRSLGHLATQLGLVRGRQAELARLEADLVQRQNTVHEKLSRLA